MSKARKSGKVRARLREQEREAQQKALEEARAQEARERKERKREAQAEWVRVARAALGAHRRAATLAAVLVLACLVAGGIVILTKGSAHTKEATTSSASTQSTEAEATTGSLLNGIPQHGSVLGAPKAPLTLQYFSDLECRSCKEVTVGALPTIILKWVRTGQLRIIFRSFQTATREPRQFATQQAAALAAGKQNKLWYYVELFYLEQGEEGTNYATPEYLGNLARQVPGLDLRRWAKDINDRAFIDQLETDRSAAKRFGLTVAPALMLGETGKKAKELIVRTPTDPTGYDEAIEHLLKRVVR